MRGLAWMLSLVAGLGLAAQTPKSESTKPGKSKPKTPSVKLPAKTAALKPEVTVLGKGPKFGLSFGKDAVVTNEVMKEMAGLKGLVGFVIHNGSGVDDTGAAEFKNNKNLEAFIVRKSKMTAKCADAIGTMTGLVDVQLSEIKLDKSAAAKIAALPKLETLFLSHTQLGDDGAEALSASKTITTLNLTDTGIHGRSMAKLAKMKQLKKLYIVENRLIRNDQVEALKKALPDLEVVGKAPLLGLRKVTVDKPAAN